MHGVRTFSSCNRPYKTIISSFGKYAKIAEKIAKKIDGHGEHPHLNFH
jgi:hypothetical protein